MVDFFTKLVYNLYINRKEIETMKKSQLLAIWYAERDRREQRVKDAGLWEDFKASRYKSLAWFLKSIDRYDLM